MTEKEWWKEAIVYQVYPRSFKDTNEDGIGDLQGVIEHLAHIKDLGANTIWINPIFESPQVDNGYDIADYYAIDPIFGTMEDAIELIEAAHEQNIKVIFDLVLNHTSDQHIWFQEALKGPENPYRAFYIWADAKENGDLPNNWASIFGGSVWEKEPAGDQYYFHLFKKEMPDLDWDNPEVEKAMLDIAKFWLDKGVDGFRLDAFIHMDKLEGFPDIESEKPGEMVSAQEINQHLPNIENYLQTLTSELREVKPDVFILGEAASADPDLAVRYTRPKNDMCDAVISFLLFPEDDSLKDPRLPANMQAAKLDKSAFKNVMEEWQTKLAALGGPTLYWNNHDMARALSRFGDAENYRKNSSKMLAALMYLQKGIPFVFYGEEIGMINLSQDDPNLFETPGAAAYYSKAQQLGYSEEHILKELNSTSRDVSRGVMQWDDDDYGGFSTVPPWSDVNREAVYNVREQKEDPNSILSFYRSLLEYKKQPLFIDGNFKMHDTKETLYVYERALNNKKAIIVCNFTDVEEHIYEERILESGWKVLLQNEGNVVDNGAITLAPYGVLVFCKGIEIEQMKNGKQD